jgi:hypothetical protein
MIDLKNFSLKEMTECGTVLRTIGQGAGSMEEVSGRIVRYFYDELMDTETGKNACSLVRVFKSHPYEDLDEELRRFAQGLLGSEKQSPGMKCLTLLATAGELPEWNSRKKSGGHKAIPLVSEKFVQAVPMISNLVKQLGLEIHEVVKPQPNIILDISKKKYNVFYVPDAQGSPIIPSQDNFVIPFGVKSVIGLGGVFPSGDLFAVILFTKVVIPQRVADLFKTLALNIKLALLPLETKVFTDGK